MIRSIKYERLTESNNKNIVTLFIFISSTFIMKTTKKIHWVIVLCFISIRSIHSQEKISVDFGADIVSSYVWRGNKQTGLSVQPNLGASYKNFSLGAWGSTDIASGSDKGFKEVDFTLSYSLNSLEIALTDYWWDGENAFHYFHSPKEGYSGQMLEATIGYSLPKAFPLSVTWNTFFMGKGNKKSNGDNSFSTYIELAYPFSVNNIDLGLVAGFIPWKSVVYGPDANGFKFLNLALTASSKIKISNVFSLPIFTHLIINPATEDIHFVFGISIQ